MLELVLTEVKELSSSSEKNRAVLKISVSFHRLCLTTDVEELGKSLSAHLELYFLQLNITWEG